MSLLIKDILIVTPDCEKTASIGVQDGKIAYIGNEPPKEFAPGEVIDGKNKAVIPALFNAHCHAAMTLFRSYADALPLKNWLFDKIFPIEGRLNGDDCYWGGLLAIAEMLSGGICCFDDMYMFAESLIKGVAESGICANLGRAFATLETGGFESYEPLNEAVSLFETYNGYDGGRIMIDFMPHAIYTCSPELIAHTANLAARLGAGVCTHLSETEQENAECFEKYKKRPAQILHEAGFFDRRCLVAHGVHLNEEEAALLARKNVTVAHCPSSNLKLGSGIIHMAPLMENGVGLAIGTDGAASNNNLNMFEETHLAAILSNGFNKNPALVSPAFALKMATENGARAMGRDNEGKIEVGYFADLAIIDLDKPHFYPRHSMLANIIYSAQAADVERTVVRGKTLYNKGEFLSIDMERVKYETERVKKRLLNGLSARASLTDRPDQ